mgnify:FL=1
MYMSSINHSQITHNYNVKNATISRMRTSDTGTKKKDTDTQSSDKAILEYYNTEKEQGKKPSIDFPVDMIVYANDKGELPSFFNEVDKKLTSKGFTVLQQTPDHFPVDKCKGTKTCQLPEGVIHVYHSPYRHFTEITLPKMELLSSANPNIRGFFVAEGDVCPIDEFNLDFFLKNLPINVPQWLGYKKVQRSKGEISYVVGNFLLYFPVEFLPVLRREVASKKGRLVYSDRFFTQLVQKGLLMLSPKSFAGEVEHYSNVAGKLRKKASGEMECDIKAGYTDDTIRAQQLKVYGDNPISKERHGMTKDTEQKIPNRFVTAERIRPNNKATVKGFGIRQPQAVTYKVVKKKPKQAGGGAVPVAKPVAKPAPKPKSRPEVDRTPVKAQAPRTDGGGARTTSTPTRPLPDKLPTVPQLRILTEKIGNPIVKKPKGTPLTAKEKGDIQYLKRILEAKEAKSKKKDDSTRNLISRLKPSGAAHLYDHSKFGHF